MSIVIGYQDEKEKIFSLVTGNALVLWFTIFDTGFVVSLFVSGMMKE